MRRIRIRQKMQLLYRAFPHSGTFENMLFRLYRGGTVWYLTGFRSAEYRTTPAISYGVGKTTVNEVRKRLASNAPRARSGPKPKLAPRERRDAVTSILRGKAKSAVEATKLISETRQDKVSSETVRRVLRKASLVAKKKQKKPFLSAVHRRNRLRWAIEHRDWTVEDWQRVIWSDETKINRICSDGNQYQWLPTGSVESAVQPTIKFGGGSIMLWGCMSWLGVGAMSRVVCRMDAQQYVSILNHCLIPTLDRCAADPSLPPRPQLIFQQDNDPKHTSRLARDWFLDEGIQVMPWPAQSPDLNPIEHLWAHLKRRIGSYPEVPGGVLELWDRVREEWPKITVEVCRSLIESMPRRVEAVIRARGGNTKY